MYSENKAQLKGQRYASRYTGWRYRAVRCHRIRNVICGLFSCLLCVWRKGRKIGSGKENRTVNNSHCSRTVQLNIASRHLASTSGSVVMLTGSSPRDAGSIPAPGWKLAFSRSVVAVVSRKAKRNSWSPTERSGMTQWWKRYSDGSPHFKQKKKRKMVLETLKQTGFQMVRCNLIQLIHTYRSRDANASQKYPL